LNGVRYDIQASFMTNLYKTLDEGGIGIFESPTGTVCLGGEGEEALLIRRLERSCRLEKL
jgi:hypothetical protein